MFECAAFCGRICLIIFFGSKILTEQIRNMHMLYPTIIGGGFRNTMERRPCIYEPLQRKDICPLAANRAAFCDSRQHYYVSGRCSESDGETSSFLPPPVRANVFGSCNGHSDKCSTVAVATEYQITPYICRFRRFAGISRRILCTVCRCFPLRLRTQPSDFGRCDPLF